MHARAPPSHVTDDRSRRLQHPRTTPPRPPLPRPPLPRPSADHRRRGVADHRRASESSRRRVRQPSREPRTERLFVPRVAVLPVVARVHRVHGPSPLDDHPAGGHRRRPSRRGDRRRDARTRRGPLRRRHRRPGDTSGHRRRLRRPVGGVHRAVDRRRGARGVAQDPQGTRRVRRSRGAQREIRVSSRGARVRDDDQVAPQRRAGHAPAERVASGWRRRVRDGR